jgi:hypothetical protein
MGGSLYSTHSRTREGWIGLVKQNPVYEKTTERIAL